MQNSHTLVFPFFSGGHCFGAVIAHWLFDFRLFWWLFLPQHLFEVFLDCLREVWFAFLMRFFLRFHLGFWADGFWRSFVLFWWSFWYWFGSSCSIPLCEEILVGSLFSFLFSSWGCTSVSFGLMREPWLWWLSCGILGLFKEIRVFQSRIFLLFWLEARSLRVLLGLVDWEELFSAKTLFS